MNSYGCACARESWPAPPAHTAPVDGSVANAIALRQRVACVVIAASVEVHALHGRARRIGFGARVARRADADVERRAAHADRAGGVHVAVGVRRDRTGAHGRDLRRGSALRAARVRDAVDAVLRRDEHEARAVRDALRRRVADGRERRRRSRSARALRVGDDRDRRAARADDQVAVGQRGELARAADVRDRAGEETRRHVQVRIGGGRAAAPRGRGRRAVVGARRRCRRVGWVVGAFVGCADAIPGAGWLHERRSARAPPPLHDASAAASNARPTSERSQS